MSKKKRLSEVERAMAEHPRGLPLVGNKLIMDPTPIAPPAGYEKQPSMIDIIRNQVQQVSRAAQDEGFETVEDANDFDVPDDPFPSSPYEFTEDEYEVPPSVQAHRQKLELEDALAEQQASSEEGDGGVLPQSDPPDAEQGETPPST